MEPNLYDRFDTLTAAINTNHTEVVQRLTALETSLKGVPERVQELEKTGAKFAGSMGVWSIVGNAAITLAHFLFRKHIQ